MHYHKGSGGGGHIAIVIRARLDTPASALPSPPSGGWTRNLVMDSGELAVVALGICAHDDHDGSDARLFLLLAARWSLKFILSRFSDGLALA